MAASACALLVGAPGFAVVLVGHMRGGVPRVKTHDGRGFGR